MRGSRRRSRSLLVASLIIIAAVSASILVWTNTSHVELTSGSGPFSPPVLPSPSAGTPTPPLLVGRDPFQPFGVLSPSPPSSISPSPAPSASPTPTPSVSPAGSPSPGPGGGSSKVVGGRVVVIDDIFSIGGVQSAQVEVDGRVFTVSVGGNFATDFTLVSIHGTCASFRFRTQPFSLCLTRNK